MTNSFGQPVGPPVPGWGPRPSPGSIELVGRACSLQPLDAERHAADLFAANAADDGKMWTYLPYGPFADLGEYRRWMATLVADPDSVPYAIVTSDRRAVGVATYLRMAPEAGTIEVGHLAFSPVLQGTTAATEAMALMMAHVFDALGYRRYEWKCNALNEPSRRAAVRLGFAFEGVFRQHMVVKGRNRDTAWYSILDGEWPALRDALQAWLNPANFDDLGHQRRALSSLTRSLPGRFTPGSDPSARRPARPGAKGGGGWPGGSGSGS